LPQAQAQDARSAGRFANVAPTRSDGGATVETVIRHSSHQTGAIGESAVVLAFERIGWGPLRNREHDVGTDLFVLVFDERGEQPGLMVGAQVKSGPSAFRAPERNDDGEVVGWWFRDDDRSHVDAWLRYTAPHVIVLYDEDTGSSYWAHVCREAVVSTGKGAKILVPSGQTIDLEHREALLAVAGADRPGVVWEGSAWTGVGDLLPRDRLRHALVAPRLIAPHPNAGKTDPIDATQAVALMIQARQHDLWRFAETHDEVPDLHDVPKDADWCWRFAAAFRQRVVHDENEDLIARVADALTPADHAAATVAAATSLIEVGRIADALHLLDAALERDEAEAVDHAWLLVQRARGRAEVGRIAEAQDDALRAQGIRLSAPGDATASAIAASAAILLFNTTSLEDKDVAALATSADTAASWWRTQIINNGLWGITERSFSAWVDREPTTHADGFPGHNKLTAAALIASHAGEQGSWRNLTAGVAKSDLLGLDRHAQPEDAVAALEQLRLAGADKALRHVTRRLVADGPAVAVATAVTVVDLSSSRRTTVNADLALLESGGDVLDVGTASRQVHVLLEALAEPGRLEARTVPGYRLSSSLVDALRGVAVAADAEAQRAVSEHILELPAVEDFAVARSWARAATALPKATWRADDAARLRGAAHHEHALHMTLLGIAEHLGDEVAHETLVEAVRGGSFEALRAFHDLGTVPSDVLSEQVATIVTGMERRRTEEQTDFHVNYVGPTELARLNLIRPDVAQWEPLLDFLADGNVLCGYKEDALVVLGARADEVPEYVVDRLRQLSASLAEHRHDGDEALVREARMLALVLGAYDEEVVADQLVALLRGDDVARVRALAAIETMGNADEHIGILIALTSDPDPDLRAWSAALLAIQVDLGRGGAIAVAALRAAATDTGTSVPKAIADALADPRSPTGRELLLALQQHLSATVRNTANARLQEIST
jgi:hypothetical protein